MSSMDYMCLCKEVRWKSDWRPLRTERTGFCGLPSGVLCCAVLYHGFPGGTFISANPTDSSVHPEPQSSGGQFTQTIPPSFQKTQHSSGFRKQKSLLLGCMRLPAQSSWTRHTNSLLPGCTCWVSVETHSGPAAACRGSPTCWTSGLSRILY